jgi:2-C-methyl-D-erythritol 4-phosphate cytidylyltransferase
MKRVAAIILAGGKGVRLKARGPKGFVPLGGMPLAAYALRTFSRCARVTDIVAVAPAGGKLQMERLVKKYAPHKTRAVVQGGARRQDSVRNGLKAMPQGCAYVLVHDAARPFVDKALINAVLDAAERYGAAIPAVAAKATIKQVRPSRAKGIEGFVRMTLARKSVWEVQTPQGFRASFLVRAFARHGRVPVTDDAMLLERMGKQVAVVRGSYDNIKVTTPEDMPVARSLARCRR